MATGERNRGTGPGVGLGAGMNRAHSSPANMVAEPGRTQGNAPAGSSGPFGIGAGSARAASVPVLRDESKTPTAQGRPVPFGPREGVRDEVKARGRSTRRRTNEDGDHHDIGWENVGDREYIGR